jgi:hypothetical protein
MLKKFSMFSLPSDRDSQKVNGTATLIACGTVYRSLAIAISDAVLSSPFSASQPGINKLLNILFKRHAIFPLSSSGNFFSDFKALLQDNRYIEKLIDSLSETLYHLTLEGLFQQPTHYHQFALPQETREYPAHWIAKSAPAVIADCLGLSIQLSSVASGKPLHASTSYEQLADDKKKVLLGYRKTLYIRERHGHYYAKVQHKALFEQLPLMHTQPQSDAPLFNKLITRLQTEIELTLQKFHRVYDRMSVMVTAGELSKEFLLQLYLSNLSSHRLNGTQDFFDSIHIEEAEHQAHMIPELLHVIARMISLGDIDESLIFNQIDEPLKLQEVQSEEVKKSSNFQNENLIFKQMDKSLKLQKMQSDESQPRSSFIKNV